MADSDDKDKRRDDDEDEDEEIDESGYKTVKDAVLFAIDVSSSMLERPPPSDDKKADRDSATLAALKCAYQLMQQRIISNPNDMMGILLIGTEKSKFQGEDENSRGGLAYPHCYLLADLDVPSATDVKRLRDLVEDEEEAEKLLVPSKEPVSMANVLFCANQIFTTKAPNFSSRRLFLVTDNDNPHANDKALRSAAAVRARDLYDLGVIIELFPISRPGHGFDRAKFYDDIVYRTTASDPDAPAPLTQAAKTSSSGDGITLLQSLLSAIHSKAAPRRALFSLPFEIGPGLKISVKGYILLKRQEPVRSCYVWLSGETAQIAVGSSTQIAEDTARAVEKTEIRKAYRFGGETISFTKEEIASIRHFGDPVIRIIGFKPMSMLPIWASTRAPMFMYPTETDYISSTRVFAALHAKLLADSKMAVAWFIARRNASPVLAALVPGGEKLSDSGDQLMPPGLWILPLPFADDIRQTPETTLVRAPDTLIDLMRTVMQQLQLPKAVYDPARYPNPALQWFYRILQALALREELPEMPEDKTVPKYRQIDKRAGGYVVEWGTELEKEYQAHVGSQRRNKQGAGAKRVSVDPEAGPPSKKVRTVAQGKGAEGVGDEEMRRNFEKGAVGKLTVPVLKDWLGGKHLPVAGKKADLVERVEGWFENR
ncbi:ATP-dependent DNA helicase II subunit 1 [Coniosporium apollinis CBS 100218]|uniref:ATP-dependent DNA helicase II subunit 1 n=1 Tax=Coniosporium apollinis (strain CBS 100218) TaxID=1168221 RepID=R7Z2M5_CONA1|nr:ATP-dependent DNA helicase II subunit 1 [Coniosporium apollinis CBS 100218]EON68348.1 ATP-dependent DNA helicase II subunit 1 [Coniosporium apollinis CBS 100218]